MLLRRDPVRLQQLALVDDGQLGVLFVVPVVLVVGGFLVKRHIARELHRIPGGAEQPSSGAEIRLHRRKLRRLHLAGDEPVPDELVQPVLVGGQLLADRGGLQHGAGGTDRLMGVLRAGLGLVDARFGGIVLLAELFQNEGLRRVPRFV